MLFQKNERHSLKETKLELPDFSKWLAEYEKSEKFNTISTKFIELNKFLLDEHDSEIRKLLIDQKRKLIDF